MYADVMIFRVQGTIFEIFCFKCARVPEIFLGMLFRLLSFSLLSLVAKEEYLKFYITETRQSKISLLTFDCLTFAIQSTRI